MELKTSKKEYITVLIIAVLFFVIGLILLQYRWINPDEGAHISDGRMLLEGKVPLVDFKSRQPFYVLLLAIFLKIFGTSYLSARLLPLVSAVGVSFLIYVISKKLFDRETGLTAQIIYVFMPFTILFSPIVKMHNIVIFWGCLGVLLYLIFVEKEKLIYLLFSGVSFGLAFYVRESSLAVLGTVVVTIVLINGRKLTMSAKQVIILIAGFFTVVFVMLAFYCNHMTFIEFWTSPLSPFDQFIKGFEKISAFLGVSTLSDSSGQLRLAGQDMTVSIKEAREIFRMNLYLFSGFALLVIYLIADFWKARSLDKKHKLAHYLLAIWVSSTLLVYVYYFFARGFFPAYALELYPPLIISVSYLFTEKFLIYKTNFLKSLTAFLIVVYAIFLFQKSVSFVPDLSFYFMMTFSLVFIYWFSREKIYRDNKTAFVIASTSFIFFVVISQSSIVTELVSGKLITGFTVLCLMLILYFAYKKKMIGTNRIFTKYFATAVFLATLIGGFGESARYLKINYDSVWSPENARLVKEYFDKNAESDNTLLSGGMIWSIHPKIKPYFDITHPTAFVSELESDFIVSFKKEINENPPDFIIEDTYTLSSYYFMRDSFVKILKDRYVKQREFLNHKPSLVIYRLITN